MSVDLRGLDGELLWMRAFRPDPVPKGWRVRMGGLDGCAYQHQDGLCVVISGTREADGKRWLHVSCSRASRLPSWEDLKRVKDTFVGPDRYAAQVLPPADFFVNLHPNVLHLFTPVDGDWPLPEFSRALPGGRRSI